MTPEQYRRVNDLAEAALGMRPQERVAFLDQACGINNDLRRSVDALLAADAAPADFLDKPLLEQLAGDLLAKPAGRDLVGQRVRNYEVISRLGAGGIGEVWLARDRTLHREVALKLLWPRYASNPYHTHRFQQEARAASALNHPNIITVYEIGETEGALFIAEERVAGETIRQKLQRGPIPREETLAVAQQIAAALTAAHAAGVVHRDIKPENVMIRPDGLVKVLDFGLARFVEGTPDGGPDTASPNTVRLDTASLPGFVLGTVRYMSPEQARGQETDGRSDQFSLGVMLYEMLAGVPPFSGATPADTLAAILTVDPAPLPPRSFERIVMRCLAKDPAERYTDEELLNELRRAGSKRKSWVPAAVACAVLAAVAIAVLLKQRAPQPAPFDTMRVTRVPTPGVASDTAISPDGKLLAYVVEERLGQSIWIRKIPSGEERAVVPLDPGQHSGAVFSPDDSFLYYRRKVSEGTGDLYRVRVPGGTPERVAGGVSGTAAISPDGARLAFVRLAPGESSLMTANADGSGETTVASLRRPQYFDLHSVAWSPDGRSIACFTGNASRYLDASFHLVEIRVSDGNRREISSRSWSWPRSVAWPEHGDFLIVVAATRGDDGYQMWKVEHRAGITARVTNDLSNYDHASVTGDGRMLAAVESDSSAAIWIAPAVRIPGAPLRSTHIALAWTPEGRLIYSDATDDGRNLWIMDADGSHRRRLTSGPGNKDQIAMSRDGSFLVYKQAGNIWRMNSDGTDARQLTHGPLDVHPDVAADDRSIVYASFTDWSPSVGGEPTLWRVPADGGTAVKIADQAASYPKVSHDGRSVAYIYFPGKDPRYSATRVAVMPWSGGAFRVLEASPSDETEFSWSPDGQALDFSVNNAGVGNVWHQPAIGGLPSRLTNFAADELFAFAWSRDGRLATARGATTRSVILIENLR